MNQSTKELIISYFNNKEDFFAFSLVSQVKPSDKPIFIIWDRQEDGGTSREYGVLMDDLDDKEIKSVITLVRDKSITKIGAYVYDYYERCLAYYDIYKASLFNSAYKHTHFIIGEENEDYYDYDEE